MNKHPDAAPSEVLDALGLDEDRRGQLEHYCAVARYSYYRDRDENDAEGLRYNRIEWEDVADWSVGKE